jgi:hypothetical protein
MILAWNMNNTDQIPSLKIRKLFPFKVNEKYVIHYTCISENLDQSKYYMHKKWYMQWYAQNKNKNNKIDRQCILNKV